LNILGVGLKAVWSIECPAGKKIIIFENLRGADYIFIIDIKYNLIVDFYFMLFKCFPVTVNSKL